MRLPASPSGIQGALEAGARHDPTKIFASAGETPIEGITSEALVMRARSAGHRDARYAAGPSEVVALLKDMAQPGDYILMMGAGNITQYAADLPAQLAAA